MREIPLERRWWAHLAVTRGESERELGTDGAAWITKTGTNTPSGTSFALEQVDSTFARRTLLHSSHCCLEPPRTVWNDLDRLLGLLLLGRDSRLISVSMSINETLIAD